jgi:hypothetical protein
MVSTTSSGTLRISDDGGSVLPLALVGTRSDETRVTAFTIGAGIADTNGAQNIDGTALRWGAGASSFTSWRRDALEAGAGNLWLRESSSHAALFDGTSVTGSARAPSVVGQYLGSTSCWSSAMYAGTSDGIVGGSLPATTFACNGLDDLAVALDGLSPRSTFVTRWSGVVPRATLGADRPLTFDPTAFPPPVAIHAGDYESCVTPSASAPNKPVAPAPAPSGGASEDHPASSDVVLVSDGCFGSTTTTETTDDSGETTTTTSDDGCGGDSTSTSKSSSEDGWDKKDDSTDSCGSDSKSSSSSKSDSCSGSSSSSSKNDDGWDTNKQALKARPKHARSPFSRYALFAAALILPLRRRARESLKLRA